MIARLVAGWQANTDWTGRFWVFAVKLYAMPWFSWRWLYIRKDGLITPFWQRVSSTLIGVIQMGFAGVLTWLFYLSVDGPLLLSLVIANLLLFKLLLLIVRAQAIFIAFGGEGKVNQEAQP